MEEKNFKNNDKLDHNEVYDIIDSEKILSSEVNNKENHKEKNKLKKDNLNVSHKKRNLLIVLCIIFIIIFSLLLLCLCNKLNNSIYYNTYILNKDISGYSIKDLESLLNNENDSIVKELSISVYQDDKKIYTVNSYDFDFKIDVDETIKETFKFGRTGNILKDNFNIIKGYILKNNLNVIYKYDEDKLADIIKNIDLSIEGRYIDDSYSIDINKKLLTIVRGKTGNSILYDKVKSEIISILKDKNDTYVIDTFSKVPDSIDLDKLYNDVHKEPSDAYIDETTGITKFIKEEYGYEIDINKLKETLLLEENKIQGKEINFNIDVIEPSKKLSDLTYAFYKDKIAGFTTYFNSTQNNRANNINIALGYLNEKVIMPGEIFSFNKTVGEITESKGYLPAATFKAGTIVNEIGGGICQTSSTLYNTVLYSNLEIVERHAHGLPVGYVLPSRDATIYVGILDFKFKNTRKYPVKIITSFNKAGSMNISIYGTKEEEEYDIEITSNTLKTIPFSTKYIYDSTLEKGKKITISEGSNGTISESYLIKRLNGTVISNKLLSKDTYNPQSAIIKIGTKE